MHYREYEAPESLRQHIQCVWRLSADGDPTYIDTVYPDGHCELIVHLKYPMQMLRPDKSWHLQADCLFAAQQRSAIRLAARLELDCIGARLQPAASAAISSTRLAELRDQIVALRDLDPDFVPRFTKAARQFSRDATDGQIWAVLESRLLAYQVDSRIEQAVNELINAEGRGSIAAIAARAAMSLRSFQTKFLQQVGLSAKEFSRILRLQATIQTLDNSQDSLAQLALQTGFSDQAHATREVRRLTGLTPARLRQALERNRAGEHTIRMAAAFVRGVRDQAS